MQTKYEFGDIVIVSSAGTALSRDIEAMVVGVATNGVPVLGLSYILESLDSNLLPNQAYPWTHFCCFEHFMRLKSEDHKIIVNCENGHTCPFKEEINGDYTSLCNCDVQQTRECAQDI